MNMKSIITFALVTVGVLVGVTALLWNFGAKPKEVQQITDVAGEMRHKKPFGDTQGKVMIVEFSDFQCPACKSVQEPLKNILAKYEGKVTFVYRHFPLTTIHKNAMISAQAAEAAGLQNMFWEMHDLLFTRQGDWVDLADPKSKFMSYAEELKLDLDRFGKDIDSNEVKDKVAADNIAANKYGLRGTPTFFVNGYETDFAQLDAKIEEILKQ